MSNPARTLLRRIALSTRRPLTSAPSRLSKTAAFPSPLQNFTQQQSAPRYRRTMSTTTTTAASMPRFSKGSDESSLSSTLETLLGQGRGWALVNDGEAVERSFKFKNFAKTWDFMTAVSLQCKIHNHHPEWSNVYNTTFIRWTTHVPKGLSDKDLKLALICDALAKDFGEVEVPASEATTGAEAVSCGIRGLADKAAGTAGDCCTPKK
ncbi:pterin 4 alpha carbinolamine dehydratase [Colletotrichum scovillei]|uniref:4a-hydroxytetrahydrobiopterin dehydratase n=1 Tax=Colletotrichum scovillei TaxID=1209932 RepID=A0A9P7R4P8_9PEZI|nr:pterin 4 alpha carbinolamine dehydratase [Colletotrichum scovillei]KAF4773554.1 pterin 4 alpha carbinolamine dehydratase [Colletotrichum scovillei]KAG7048680.1 pterin 4 alpha carbinolamine dehydratase [Colletotrichum scovillei]KAG7065843.1 pterin 4 alpha carbinolamine dehydratase [Colletotrichum scovillei]KAG7068445.1 pterin 4 alpha carbinolamine dehydratase [Colletotrichum scovillei]